MTFKLTVAFKLGQEASEDMAGRGGHARESGKVAGPKDARSWVGQRLIGSGCQWERARHTGGGDLSVVCMKLRLWRSYGCW